MVVDTCIFFNELDLLEIRWNHLNPHVDRFVLVESLEDFQGRPKPAYFWENRSRYQDFLHKVVHVLLPSYPKIRTAAGDHYGDTWAAEHLSRDILKEVIRYLDPDDFIVIADVDEIPDLRKWDRESEGLFECYQHYYYLDYRDVDYVMAAPCIVKRSTIDRFGSVQSLRRDRNFLPRIPKAGWHYSCMGGPDAISYKLQAFSHQEYNHPHYTDPTKIAARIKIGRDLLDRDHLHTYERVKIDNTFPPYVQNNLLKFEHLLSPHAIGRHVAVDVLRDFKSVLDRTGTRFCLDGGTLLGAYRDGDFCEEDHDDIDLSCMNESHQSEIETLAVSRGFELVKSFKGSSTTTPQSILSRDGIKVDLMFKRQKGDKVWWTIYYAAGDDYRTVLKAAPFFDFNGSIVFHGLTFRRPKHVEEYLQYRYGNWKKPVPSSEFSCFISDRSVVDSLDDV